MHSSHESNKEFNYGRDEANQAILDKISSYLKKRENSRFIQALLALNIIDREFGFSEDKRDYYREESTETLQKIKKF